jgi:23S rRNA pseudouridine1911/1915/1917 synthase
MSTKVTVLPGQDGRVDKALAAHYPDAGRRQLAELFDGGAIRVRGRRAKKGDRVEVGDIIELDRTPVSGDALRPAPDPSIALELLVERPDWVAVNKPAGIPSQPLRAGELGTVANALAARFPECAAIGDDPRDGGLVHRLDIGTSGVLIAARTAQAYAQLRDLFGSGQIEKQYLAITDQRPVSRESDAPLVQRGNHVAVDHTDGLAAYTQFIVERATDAHALVRCIARTGRMHQVRAHLAHVGSPITGDTLYKGAALPGHDGFFLHASRVALPDTTIEAPLPARFSAALSAVGL